MNVRKLWAALFASLLLIGACGSDDGDDNASTDDTKEASSDTSSDDNESTEGESSDNEDASNEDADVPGVDEECITASGAAISLGLMPMMLSVLPMGEAFTDETILAESDIEEMQSSIDDLKESVPDELSDDVEALADMSSDAIDDPESFDDGEWEEAMSGINTYLEEECADSFDLGDMGDLGDLGDLGEDLSDMTVPE